MTTDNTLVLPTPAPAPLVPAPATSHGYVCSDCIATTRATEIHYLGDDDYTAYCGRCAHLFRRFAQRVYTAAAAHARGITVNL